MSAREQGPLRDRVPETERAVEWGLVALVVVVCGVVGLPAVVSSLRDGSVDLATIFYPVLLVAFAVLPWTRRTDQ